MCIQTSPLSGHSLAPSLSPASLTKGNITTESKGDIPNTKQINGVKEAPRWEKELKSNDIIAIELVE